MNQPTIVTSVRKRKRNDMEADPRFVYVGRAVRYTTWDLASHWANPFSASVHGGQALTKFNAWLEDKIRRDPDLLHRLRAELGGKILGCWCGEWEPGQPPIGCHAVTLANYANGEGPT